MIGVFRPELDTEAILEQLRPVLQSGWIGHGPKTAELEGRLAEVTGAGKFIATSSCTGALHLAVHALDLPPGSAVLTTPITFVSTNAVLLYEGLIPVFGDVEPRSGNLDAGAVADAIDHHDVKAVMVVHVGGYPANMVAINKAARSRGIPVVEDCAHALGATLAGRPLGATANLCCWSFHAVKNLPMGDGGGISTSDEELAKRLRRLSWMGITKSTSARTTANGYEPGYDVPELGFRCQMNDITAAIGLAMLPRLAGQNDRRRRIADRYLAEIETAEKPEYDPGRRSSFHFLPMFFNAPEEVAGRLRQADIHPGMHYHRNDLYPPFADYPKTGDLAGADWYERHELTLPLHPGLTDEDVDRIIEVVNG